MSIVLPFFFLGIAIIGALEFRLNRDIKRTLKVIVGLRSPTKQYIVDLSILSLVVSMGALIFLLEQCTV
ncbi:hypothetical protein [Hasllibacter sp. MH4015]|uniref:hypothetical protein n=1 Tax=Hasllibacter sp. MH4015 TaxID=2854029 RepID=UPI001CD70503|nr:hypothetical protein [Hasllibacter sp. MH4015]